MTSESPLFPLLDFYLSPAFPTRHIELLKLKLQNDSKRVKDPLLKEVALIREILKVLDKRRKAILPVLHHVSPKESQTSDFKLIQALFDLSPKDFLILISLRHFPIKIETLSLALNLPAQSIAFRRKQLEIILTEDSLSLDHFSPTKVSFSSDEPLPKHPGSLKSIAQRFQGLPIALRFAIETSAILASLLALLWVIPEIRNRYENSIQKRINEYLIESSLVDAPAPEGTSKTPRTPNLTTEGQDSDSDEVVSKSSSSEPSNRKQPKVNDGETWRFSFTGSSTPEIETGVTEALEKLKASAQKPITVPGGIQFDFVLPTDQLINLKTVLEQKVGEIQQKSASSKVNLMSLANLSWYKKKNMGTRKIPNAHVQVIIWISTL